MKVCLNYFEIRERSSSSDCRLNRIDYCFSIIGPDDSNETDKWFGIFVFCFRGKLLAVSSLLVLFLVRSVNELSGGKLLDVRLCQESPRQHLNRTERSTEMFIRRERTVLAKYMKGIKLQQRFSGTIRRQ